MSSTRVRYLFTASALIVAGLTGTACGDDSDSGEADETQTLRFVGDDVEPDIVDLGEPGTSVGDMAVFDGPVLDENGEEEVGHYYGTQTAIAVDDTQVVQIMMTYDLGDGDTLTIGGVSEYPLDDAGLVNEQEFTRPVIGGTGQYAGARGTVTTVRGADGDYSQTFRIETS